MDLIYYRLYKSPLYKKVPYLPKNPLFDQVSDKVKDLNLETLEGPQELSQQTQEQKRVSKAQKRRNKKEEAARQRQEKISKQEIENESGARNVEFQKLKEMLKKQGLQIFEIPSDGNCLYNAVAHQVNHKKTITDCKQLRKQAAEYMRGKNLVYTVMNWSIVLSKFKILSIILHYRKFLFLPMKG